MEILQSLMSSTWSLLVALIGLVVAIASLALSIYLGIYVPIHSMHLLERMTKQQQIIVSQLEKATNPNSAMNLLDGQRPGSR